MRNTILFILLLCAFDVCAQNCSTFKMSGDTLQYEACMIAEEVEEFGYYQFSKEYQVIYDKALEKCDYFATAYHAKSVAYLKSGDFIEWKRLMDKAVELKPKEYLNSRGWCLFQFCKDYKGAIRDIEELDRLINYDIGYSSDGAYHLEIVRALCYKKIGQQDKALDILATKLNEENFSPGPYDYLHYGVMLLESQNNQEAIVALEKQIDLNGSAECYYYLALANKQLNQTEEYKSNLERAKYLYQKGNMMTGDYVSHVDKIYLLDIEREIAEGM